MAPNSPARRRRPWNLEPQPSTLHFLAASALLALLPGASSMVTDCRLQDVINIDGNPELDSFWEQVVRPSSTVNVDTGTAMDQARFFMRWADMLVGSDELVATVGGNCLFGAMTLLLQALPAVEYMRSNEQALSLLGRARNLMSLLSDMPDVTDVVVASQAQHWNTESLGWAFQLYDAFLPRPSPPAAEETRDSDCKGPRIYVYPPPPLPDDDKSIFELLHGGRENYHRAMAQGPLQCMFGMYGTEFLFHHTIRSTPCAVEDPEMADLFFVPSYFKCIEVLNFVDGFDGDGVEAPTLLRQTTDYVRAAGPWFERLDGADHVFLFSWGRFPCAIPGWRSLVGSAILLQVENNCEDVNSGEAPNPSFSRWKDIIIPGHVDQFRVLELQQVNLPTESRNLLIAFHGRYGGNAESYVNVSVRTKVMRELGDLPGVSVGGFIDGYHELLGRSHFCLAPRGITPWTVHLYVAIMAGCIPVILSDDMELPFTELVDWPSMSIKWPAHAAGAGLHKYLQSMEESAVKNMKEAVDKAACWFNYYSRDDTCSPYKAVLHALEDRHRRLPQYPGRFWGAQAGPLPDGILPA